MSIDQIEAHEISPESRREARRSAAFLIAVIIGLPMGAVLLESVKDLHWWMWILLLALETYAILLLRAQLRAQRQTDYEVERDNEAFRKALKEFHPVMAGVLLKENVLLNQEARERYAKLHREKVLHDWTARKTEIEKWRGHEHWECCFSEFVAAAKFELVNRIWDAERELYDYAASLSRADVEEFLVGEDVDFDEASEARLAQRAAKKDGNKCPSCEAPYPQEALYCQACGASLTTAGGEEREA